MKNNSKAVNATLFLLLLLAMSQGCSDDAALEPGTVITSGSGTKTDTVTTSIESDTNSEHGSEPSNRVAI